MFLKLANVIKLWYTKLCNKWVLYTYLKASKAAELDRIIYGNGFIVKRWWGWKRVHPMDVLIYKEKEKI